MSFSAIEFDWKDQLLTDHFYHSKPAILCRYDHVDNWCYHDAKILSNLVWYLFIYLQLLNFYENTS